MDLFSSMKKNKEKKEESTESEKKIKNEEKIETDELYNTKEVFDNFFEHDKVKNDLKNLDLDKDKYIKIKNDVQDELLKQFDENDLLTGQDTPEFKNKVRRIIVKVVDKQNLSITSEDKTSLIDELFNATIGFGKLEPLIRNPVVTEIMVNSKEKVYVEIEGTLKLTDVTFTDDAEITEVIQRILSPLNRHIDEASPYVDARLPDGSRVNAIIPPLALKGPCLTIRKFREEPFTVNDLINVGTMTENVANFFEAMVKSRLNILVSGGTGSGKTTTLNVLSLMIPKEDRIITIEDSAELKLQQPHVVTLESRPKSAAGTAEVSIRDLVKNSLRMRPDRIIVGECRGEEALDMLQAMNTGHDGSLTTGHANSPKDMLLRLETMVLMAGMDLPVKAIRQQIASAIDVIIQQKRFADGSRRIVSIMEVQGMEGENIITQEVFRFKEYGRSSDGKIKGSLEPCGIRPAFMSKIVDMHNDDLLEDDIFTERYSHAQ